MNSNKLNECLAMLGDISGKTNEEVMALLTDRPLQRNTEQISEEYVLHSATDLLAIFAEANAIQILLQLSELLTLLKTMQGVLVKPQPITRSALLTALTALGAQPALLDKLKLELAKTEQDPLWQEFVPGKNLLEQFDCPVPSFTELQMARLNA